MVETRGDGEATNATAGQGVGPENSNQINVSVKKNPNFYVFLGKKYLETHETIELHALGNAVSTSVIASENLVRYVTFFSPYFAIQPYAQELPAWMALARRLLLYLF